ncbi:MAG: hypothetical protein H7210_06325 [Pyrinomonadaceae bacterium]|nr:hypothetical protein [Phycisphaerales bacterium]
MTAAPSYSHTCPRCGYDQSGLIATWQSACPLTGTCSECGLEFEWTDVFNAGRKLVRWFIEHERRGLFGWRLLFSALRTFAWTILPWRFWNKVRLHHPIRRERWAVWLLLVLGLFHLISVAARTATGAYYGGPMIFTGTAWMTPPPPAPSQVPELVLMYLLESIAQPIARIDNTTLAGIMPITWTPLSQWHIEWLITKHDYYRGNVWGTFAPSMMAVSLAFPLMLYILPDTRRIAKVRTIHLVRGFVYSLSWIAALSLFRAFSLVARLFDNPYSLWTSPTRGWVWSYLPGEGTLFTWRYYVLGLLFLWLSVWWLACIWRGLRLPRPLLTWALVLVAVTLVGTLALIWSDSYVLL